MKIFQEFINRLSNGHKNISSTLIVCYVNEISILIGSKNELTGISEFITLDAMYIMTC